MLKDNNYTLFRKLVRHFVTMHPGEPDPGCVGCGGGGGIRPTPQNPSPGPEFAGIKITGGTDNQVNNLMKVFTNSKVKDYAPINALFNKLNEKKVSSTIQKKVEVSGKNMAASCSPPDAYGRI